MASQTPQSPSSQSPRPVTKRQDSTSSEVSSRPYSLASPIRSTDPATSHVDALQSQLGSSTNLSATPMTQNRNRTSSNPEQTSDDEPRKCWICFEDESDDTHFSSEWRSPCPCALTAHESCLLDWVADLEAPSTKKRRGAKTRIQCPQCKKSITVARPRSYVVEGVSLVEAAVSRLVVPGICMTLAGTLYAGCWIHGLTSVYVVFGKQDFKTLMGIESQKGVSIRWACGLPLIPVVLVLSRTQLIDSILPSLPMLFLATKIQERNSAALQLWPPSAAMAFAALPYLRGAYNKIYKRLFTERLRQWTRDVQPRSSENGETPAERQQGMPAFDDGLGFGLPIELNLEVEVFEHDDVEDVLLRDQDRIRLPGEPEIHLRPPPPGGDNPAQGPQAAEPQVRQPNLIVNTSRLADTIFGALSFPIVAAVMGALIKIGLPRKWTIPTDMRSRPGMLQTVWGRSIVGGCFFVVMKDTLTLYSRYRVARDHRRRRIVNYDRRQDRATAT